MEFTIRYSLESMNEAGRITRRWFYWPSLLLRGGYGLLLGVAVTFGVLQALLHAWRPDLVVPIRYLWTLGAVILAIILGALYRREVKKHLKRIADIGSAQMTVSDEGIGTVDAKGVRHFSPWSTYTQFEEGKKIFLLKLGAEKQYWPIPKDCLTELEAASLRSLLLSRLPEA